MALVDRERVNALAAQYFEFLPGARDVPPEGRLALAHIALAHGLDPFLKEAWAIPVKDRQTKQIIGFEIMVGITGWRRSAHDSNEYWGRRFEQCSPDERKWLRAGPDDLAIKCIILRRKTGQQPMEFDGYGVFKTGEFSKMNPLQCVRNRAERDAMKAAFPITLHVPGGKVTIVDDAGEIINGEVVRSATPMPQAGEDMQQHPSIEDEIAQTSPAIEAETATAGPAPTATPHKPRPAALIAANVARRWNDTVAFLASEIEFYRYPNGEPNRYRIVLSAGQMGYSEINGDNLDSVLQDLRQHATEQTQEVPAEAS
jgi:hypothetical protein